VSDERVGKLRERREHGRARAKVAFAPDVRRLRCTLVPPQERLNRADLVRRRRRGDKRSEFHEDVGMGNRRQVQERGSAECGDAVAGSSRSRDVEGQVQ
jgi:hypothetical protein